MTKRRNEDTPPAAPPAAAPADAHLVGLETLTPDPQNARKHGVRNRDAIQKSLEEVGAGRSIVIDEAGVVLAGNATVEAAGKAGLTKVRIVDTDGQTIVAVRRTGLTPEQKTRLALFDNRTAELADGYHLDVLDALMQSGVPMDGLWTDAELAALFGAEPEPAAPADEPEGAYRSQFGVVVICADEAEQQRVYEDLTGQGLTCKVVVT